MSFFIWSLFFPFFTAAGFVLITAPFFISFLKNRQNLNQPIRLNGPAGHLVTKKGTPTMGGLLIFGGLALSVVMWGHLKESTFTLIALSSFAAFSLIGLSDDILKIWSKSHRGLPGLIRLFLEISVAFLTLKMLMHTQSIYFTLTPSHLIIPIWGEIINLGALYLPFALFLVVGSANAVNLTDGLDALATSTALIALIALDIISGTMLFSIPQEEHGLFVFMAAMAGALLAFLWFNKHPAKVFMGDVGSLALGGTLGLLSIMIKQELVWAIIGFLFVIETLSVILQVVSFKLRGKRIFLMAPIHHHFEKMGWSEKKIVFLFIFSALLFAFLGIATFFYTQHVFINKAILA